MIRDATEADIPGILAVWNPVIRETAITFEAREKNALDLRETLKARRRAGHAFAVVDRDGEIEGFATYAQFRAGIGYCRTMEHTIVLAPGGRGRGIGRQLMDAIEAHAAGAGAHSMIAGISCENPDGIAFHHRIGFRHTCVLPRVGFKFGRWMDLCLMQKFL